jgi:DNA repair protein RadA/Sms
MVKRKTKFICQECGYESPKWMGKCPGCGQWNKMVEEVEVTGGARRGAFAHSQTGSNQLTKPMKINAIEMENEPRIMTDLNELNRVLGGGVVKGSLVLIGGDPGIGKSTLLLQVSSQLANKGNSVLYIYF